MEFLWLFVGSCIGGIATYFIVRFKSTADSTSLLIEQEKVKLAVTQVADLKRELELQRGKVIELNNSLSATEADYRNLQEKLADNKKELDSLQDKFSVQFKNLANEIFEEKSKKFTEQNKSNLF